MQLRTGKTTATDKGGNIGSTQLQNQRQTAAEFTFAKHGLQISTSSVAPIARDAATAIAALLPEPT